MATGVDVTLGNKELGQAAASYSFQEDATPVNIADSSAGVGQITVDVTDFPDSAFSFDKTLQVQDPIRGKTIGYVRDVSPNRATKRCTLVADSMLSLFNATRRAMPMVPKNIRNVATNPRGASLTNFGSSPGVGGNATLVASISTLPFLPSSVLMSWNAATTAVGGGVFYRDFGIVAGSVYTFSGYVRLNKTQRMVMNVEWKDAAGVTISVNSSAQVVISSGVNTRMSVAAVTAPARAIGYTLSWYSAAGTGASNWLSGNTMYVTAIMATLGSVLYDYRDGNNGNWAWESTIGQSASNGVPVLNAVVASRTLEDAFRYYATDLCGMPANLVAVDPSLASIPVAFPGWEDNVWSKMREMAVVFKAEIALVNTSFGATATLRPVRQRSISTSLLSDFTRSISATGYAQFIEVVNQNAVHKAAGLAYPENGFRFEGSVLQVDTNETIKQRFSIKMDLVSVNQPVMQSRALPIPYLDGSGPGVYTVIGNDGKPIEPAFWRDYGGSVSVALTENPFEIEVTVQGPSSKLNSPFRLAESDGKTTYPALYITGNGIYTEPEKFRTPTGVAKDKTSTETGITIDCPFVTDKQKMFTAAFQAVKKFSTAAVTVTGNLPKYNNGSSEFGLAIGSRMDEYDGKYRVSTTNFSAPGFSATAELDVIGSDFAKVAAGKTGLALKARWGSTPGKYFALEPLRSL